MNPKETRFGLFCQLRDHVTTCLLFSLFRTMVLNDQDYTVCRKICMMVLSHTTLLATVIPPIMTKKQKIPTKKPDTLFVLNNKLSTTNSNLHESVFSKSLKLEHHKNDLFYSMKWITIISL